MISNMAIGIILKNLFVWIYFVAPLQFLKIWSDFIWFLYNFFSIHLLTTTLFSRWQQIGEVRHKRGFEELFSVIVLNSLMRIVGFIIRTIVIIFGLVVILFAILFGAAAFIVWFLLPVIMVITFATGAHLLIL